jgi:glutathione-independent formaldehyde dehydrogenase
MKNVLLTPSFGCETIVDQRYWVQEQIAMIVGIPEVDCFVDCWGFEASGHGEQEKSRLLF